MKDQDLESRQPRAAAGTGALLRWYPAWRCMSIAVLAGLLLLTAIASWAEVPASSSPASLRAQYAVLQGRLNATPFAQPLVLESKETSSHEQGEIHAIVDYPFATVKSALGDAAHWCDILILHLNVKYCHASEASASNSLAVQIGRKYPEALDARRSVVFAHEVASEAPDYFQTRLTAESGPYSTTQYSIVLEAVPLPGGRTFLHLSFSYGFGARGALAMRAYLATAGSGKIGFTVVGRHDDGAPSYIGDVRGVLERNTMRYYLAIDAYLKTLSSPPQDQLERRLGEWYASTERYSAQLHELDETAYLAMKRDEYRRQQSTP